MIKELIVKGLRGYSIQQKISFSLPDNINEGSGISIIAGANNSGKSTIVESIKSFVISSNPTYSVGKRNKNAGDRISIIIIDEANSKFTIDTVTKGGSETIRSKRINTIKIVPSRRSFHHQFINQKYSSDSFVSSENNKITRENSLQYFQYRINEINSSSYDAYNRVLFRILGEELDWTIDQDDSENNYIKITYGTTPHNTEGAGEGIISAMVIAATLFDSKPKETIVIDEPELSLHPSLQKNLMKLLEIYSKDRQIIICTHSLFFVSWESFKNGASLFRSVKEKDTCVVYKAKQSLLKDIANTGLTDNFNPHLIGLTANEVFFLKDNIILVEGQEDVVFYSRNIEKLGLDNKGTFFGWGCGGAEKIPSFIELFKSLGYKHVSIIFDGDKKKEFEECNKKYNSYSYNFLILPKDDIRDKEEIKHRNSKEGMCDIHGNIKAANKAAFIKIIDEINKYNE